MFNLVQGAIKIFQVYIKELRINGTPKIFVPFWLGSLDDIESAPYTSDCSGRTSRNNTHAYSEFTIIDGELVSPSLDPPEGTKCIIKPAG